MILIRVNAEANFKICIIENKNPSKISKKISFVSHDYDKRVCVDSPRSWSPFQTFVQRALRSGIIFLTRRHRKLGRTRVVDTVHSSLSLSLSPSSFVPVCARRLWNLESKSESECLEVCKLRSTALHTRAALSQNPCRHITSPAESIVDSTIPRS